MWVSLEHGKTAYWADILLYLAAVLLLALLLATRAPPERLLLLLGVAAAGLLGWTLFEYLLHRGVLHGMPPFKRWHALHHARPAALIGTPTVLSAPLMALLFFLPPLWLSDVWLACALSLGVLAGDVGDVGDVGDSLIHHAIHRWRARSAWLLQLKRHHARHHLDQEGGNYGVTSAFWDHVFGSTLTGPGSPAHRPVRARRLQG